VLLASCSVLRFRRFHALTSSLGEPGRCLRSLRCIRRLLAAALTLATLSASAQSGTALVRHAPEISGTIDGSLQLLRPENLSLSGQAKISRDLLVPGTPAIRQNGKPKLGATIDGSGAAAPSSHAITLSGTAFVGRVVRRTDPLTLPRVSRPLPATGNREVTLRRGSAAVANFATVRDLKLAEGAGLVAVPPGDYGEFKAESGTGLVLGIAGATAPAVYQFQRLELAGTATVRVVGPVEITLGTKLELGSEFGAADHPEWLTLQIAGEGLEMGGKAKLHGYVVAPDGQVEVNGTSQLSGGLIADEVSVHGTSLVRLIERQRSGPPPNLAPGVMLSTSAGTGSLPAPARLTLDALATDADGTVAEVEFYSGGSLLGAAATPPFSWTLRGLDVGTYVFTARARDNLGATADSAPVTVVVTRPENIPPAIAWQSPAENTVYAAPASIPLIATAQDSDGTVARVTFLNGADGTMILGESIEGPVFSFTWTNVSPGAYTLLARATDDGGAVATSEPLHVTVLATLPHFTGWEAAEGFAPGLLNGQAGWQASGPVDVTNTRSLRGAQAVSIAAAQPPGEARTTFAPGGGAGVVFVDFFTRPAVGTASGPATVVRAAFGAVGIAAPGSPTNAEIGVWRGDSGAGTWSGTGAMIALDPAGQPAGWTRLTMRADFVRKTWELSVDGRLVATDVPFLDRQAAEMTALAFSGGSSGGATFDDLYIGGANPLFTDADHDGLDDTRETELGLDPTRDDRTFDPDGDGLNNLAEYLAGTNALRSDTDGDGLPDGWEVRFGLNPLANDAGLDLVGDGVTNAQKFLLGRNPRVLAQPDIGDAAGLRLFRPASR
jgi:hypothetical protein